MHVPYLDLKQQFAEFDKKEFLGRFFSECQFVLGSAVEEFETAFAAQCQTEFAIGVNSGTDALFLALKAQGIGPGDEVITAPNSFIATAGAIAASGAKPVFVDVGDDYNIDIERIELAITPRTKAIMPVHLTGNPANMGPILNIANRHSLCVIEDAAQSIGAEYSGKRTGSFGMGCFSLHPLKNLNVCGDGGMITTSSEPLAHKLRQLRNHGLAHRNESLFFGYCSRLDTFHALIGLENLKQLDHHTAQRITNAQRYDQGLQELTPWVRIPKRSPEIKQVFHTYIIRVQDRENLIAYLAEKHIDTKIHYPVPIHLQPAGRQLGYGEGDFPECEQQCREILTLPVHQYLSQSQIDYTIDSIISFYKKEAAL